jgi:uroporphyrinogen-III synthase
MSAGALAGRRIVVTRPREQSAALAARIRAAGGEALVFPAIEIEDLPDPAPVHALADRLEELDLAIFVSPSAVHKALALLRARRGTRPWPVRLRVAAIGAGSRAALEREGFVDVIAPHSGADSEALLALAELADVAGRRIVILRGEGGRERLGEALAARGARVERVACYRRSRPAADPEALQQAWARGAVHAVAVSSGEGLENLRAMLGEAGARWLRQTPLFVPHARVAAQAARLGIREAIVAGPGDRELVAGLVAYFGGAK